ncbi:GPW/gp25 family protein [Thermodesulfovibrio yellowstonii]|uniref:GPW/gp25 family protein n=1 Tax=Thermodesulfovibrio yellowstonii TaxID=28262 RepID=UPI0024B3613F|nr:GPW/gp25 family protein [Thermodesulfovibrio yellowstonii]MDI6865772.1 GPW/gp25 family protein [Thermodesulfovibrio yellowstonii]
MDGYSLIERDIIKSVNQNIRLILTTLKGSDVHRPDFGSELPLLIDKPLTAINAGRIKALVVDEIKFWEPRVKVKEVLIEKGYASLRIRIQYEIVETGEVAELWL